MKDKKKNYQEPAVNVIKMRSRGCILAGSHDADESDPDPHGEGTGARQKAKYREQRANRHK